MPLSIPQGRVTPDQFDAILAAGYRRSGWYFYRTQCHECSACEPLRIEVEQFHESRSMRRVRKLGDEHLRLEIAQPMLDEERLRVFNLHRSVRKLDHVMLLLTRLNTVPSCSSRIAMVLSLVFGRKKNWWR